MRGTSDEKNIKRKKKERTIWAIQVERGILNDEEIAVGPQELERGGKEITWKF